MSEVLNMIKYVINSRTRHFRFSWRTRTPSVQSHSLFARRLLTALWRLVLLPLCVTFPTTHTFLKNGLLPGGALTTYLRNLHHKNFLHLGVHV